MSEAAILAAILDFEKATRVASRPPGLNFIETLRTIEKNKETIVTGPNKVTGSCHWTITETHVAIAIVTLVTMNVYRRNKYTLMHGRRKAKLI